MLDYFMDTEFIQDALYALSAKPPALQMTPPTITIIGQTATTSFPHAV